MTDSATPETPTTAAASDNTDPESRPTAAILGDFHRELRAQGFSTSVALNLTEMAARELFNRGPLRTAGGERS